MADTKLPFDYQFELLKQEIDLIDRTLTRLDEITLRTKWWTLFIWGGSLYLVAQHLPDISAFTRGLLFMLSGLIPFFFMLIDLSWRKAIRRSAARQGRLSHYLNSESFRQRLSNRDLITEFPLLDPTGSTFVLRQDLTAESPWDEAYLTAPISGWRVLFYKDSSLFYLVLVLISLVFGGVYLA